MQNASVISRMKRSRILRPIASLKRHLQLRVIPRLKGSFEQRTFRFRTLVPIIGVRAAFGHLLRGLNLRRGSEYWIQPKQVAHPLCVRTGTSDINVLRQIFVKREYGCLDDMIDVRLIIDCGANVGYSSAYFLSQHPSCQVVGIEPDAGNFAVLQRNLAAYGGRAKVLNAGVWSHTVQLAISQDRYRDGREWSKQVRVCGRDETGDIDGVDVGSILAASGHERISLLKMDVEGAEAVVFSENCGSWLDKVDVIAIELHDDSIFGNASEVFFAAISGHGFQVSRSGELTICKRPTVN